MPNNKLPTRVTNSGVDPVSSPSTSARAPDPTTCTTRKELSGKQHPSIYIDLVSAEHGVTDR